MRWRPPAWALALIVVLLALPAAVVPSASAWDGRPRLHLFHLTGGGLRAADAAGRDVVVLNAWEWPRIAELKKANPAVRVLVYKDLSSTRDYPGAVDGGRDALLLPSGVGFVAAEKAHPDWFALDDGGRRVEWKGFAHHWQMDVGNPAYQRAWVERVAAELADYGWDGVFADNALTTMRYYLPDGRLAAYPSDAALQQATRSMLALVGPELRRLGFTVVANISDARRYPGLWPDWVSLVDGGYEEHFATFESGRGDAFLAGDDLRAQLDQITGAEAQGRTTGNQVQGVRSARARTYGLAAFLLATDGRSTIGFGDPSSRAVPGEVDRADRLGAPRAAMRATAPDVYAREFEHGAVVLNAGSSEARVPTGRGLVRLGPKSARIVVPGGRARPVLLFAVAGMALLGVAIAFVWIRRSPRSS